MKKLRPANIVELRQTFPHADLVGECIVFNIAGNKYRVLAHIDYTRQTVKIEAVLDHKEYDKNVWKELF